jgi:hypothetical protein
MPCGFGAAGASKPGVQVGIWFEISLTNAFGHAINVWLSALIVMLSVDVCLWNGCRACSKGSVG